MLRVLVIVLALLVAPAAWAQVCTLGFGVDGIEEIGPIGTYSDDCDETGAPAATDTVIIPNGLTLVVEDNLAFTGDGGLYCQDGGALIVNNVDQTDLIVLSFEEGMDGVHATLDNVAIYQEAGCTFTFNGALLEYGKASPGLVETHTLTNDTTWDIDWLWPCYGGSAGRMDSYGFGDCTTAGYDELVSFYYHVPISDPGAATTGDRYINDAIINAQSLPTGLLACGEPETAWAGHCYPIQVLDSSGVGEMDVTVSILQNTSATDGLMRSEDNADYPMSRRELKELELSAAINPGDVCISLDGGSVTASGDYIGRWVRLPGDLGRRPFKIVGSDAANACDGGAGDSIYVDSPGAEPYRNAIPFYVDPALSVIVGYEFAGGDTYTVHAPVTIEILEGTTAGQGLLVFEGTNYWSSVQIIGARHTLIDGGILDGGQVHWFSGGVDGSSVVKLIDTPSFHLKNSSIVGGSVLGGADGLELAGVTEGVLLESVAFRYQGGWPLITSAGAATPGAASILGMKCEMAGVYGGTIDATSGCIFNGHIPSLGVSQISTAAINWGVAGSTFLTADDTEIRIRGLGMWGETHGGMTAGSTTSHVYVSGLVARGAVSSRTAGTQPWLANINGGEVGGYACAACTGPMANSISQYLERLVIYESTTFNDSLLSLTAGNAFRDIIVIDAETTIADPTGSSVILLTNDNLAATDPALEQISVVWSTGTTTAYRSAIADTGAAGTEDAFYFGGILTDALEGDNAGAAYSSIDLSTDIISVIDQRAGGICAASQRGGTTGTNLVDDIASYTITPTLGLGPRYKDASNGDYSLVLNTAAQVLGCGALNPGFTEAGNSWLMVQLGIGGR